MDHGRALTEFGCADQHSLRDQLHCLADAANRLRCLMLRFSRVRWTRGIVVGRRELRHNAQKKRVSLLVIGALTTSLASGVALPPQSAAATGSQSPVPPYTRAVPGLTPVTVRKTPVPNAAAGHFVPTPVSWPAAKTTSVTPSASPVHATGAPVWAQSVAAGTEQPAGTQQSSVAIDMRDHQTATAAGVAGVVFTATPTPSASGAIRVGIDYAGFADAYGGNFGSRLQLVELPACALTTPQLANCRTRTPLASTNNTRNKTVSAVLPAVPPTSGGTARVDGATVPGARSVAPLVLAATTSSSDGDGGGPAGTYSATSLKPSGSWSAGGSSGSFTYSYPMAVPPAASSLVPTVSLSYDSGSVDGQTAATQEQASWIGDGWSSSTDNYIEQSFVGCSDSPEGTASPSSTSDSCYAGPVLTLSLNGSTTALVPVSGNVWKSTSDNGEIVTHVTGSNNGTGTYNTDYWTVADRTGTVFSFGRNELPGWSLGKAVTNSVQSEPVFSAHPNDPCYNSAGFAQSVCTMAYRWNLDYVRDVHGNAMAYYYKQDTNAYAENGNTASAVPYVRDAHLDHIDYGFTDGNAYTGSAPDRVVFATGDRCTSGTCDPLNAANAGNWPDVPQDLQCTVGASCQYTGLDRTGFVGGHWFWEG